MLPDIGLSQCPGLAVSMNVMHHVVRVESSYNPYAIGVVGGRLVRQPKNLPEALATVRMLEGRGYNFSLGLAQVNRYNLAKYGIGSYEQAFEACPNLKAGSEILAECYRRSNSDWGKSFSCYYSGDFATGFRHGYVQKIYASIRSGWKGQDVAVDPMAIPLVERRIAAPRPAPAQAPAAVASQPPAYDGPANFAAATQTFQAPPAAALAPSTSRLAASRGDSTFVSTVERPMSPAIVPVPSAAAQPRAMLASAVEQSGLPAPVDGPVLLTPDGPVMPGAAVPTAASPTASVAGAAGLVDTAFVF